MLDVQNLIVKAIKKELFKDNDELNTAARTVLSEMKTNFIDIREEITTQIQYKMLQKMKKNRENSIKIYTEAFEKTKSPIAQENLNKAKIELEPICLFLIQLENEMPKKLSEVETKQVIIDLINELGDNKGLIMKSLKSRTNIDMALAAQLYERIKNAKNT